MTTLFWILFWVIFYCYFGYPLALMLIALVAKKKLLKKPILPSVSIVLSVWNEEDVIERKLNNLLSLDYPQNKVEVLIGSDGSTDKTNTIVEGYSNSRIILLKDSKRKGKMETINNLVKKSDNDVIIFTDARQVFEKNAIKQLVKNFADPTVGCVSGELIFRPKEGGTAKGVSLYWCYEKLIRRFESRLHSMLGATGAIYAIRRSLFENVPQHVVLDDMYVPLCIIAKGFRAIFDETAKAYDDVAESPREEYRRKTRTLFGNYQIFFAMPQMFNPLSSPIAIQLFSHKFLRVIIPFLMGGIYGLNIFLLELKFFQVSFILQNIFYIMALIGALVRYKKNGILHLISKVCYVPYVFCLLNFSALVGFVRFLNNKQSIQWKKAREVSS